MSAHRTGRAVGAPVARVEGPAKLTGAARYSMDNSLPGMLYAVLVGASIARGTIASIDTNKAVAIAGVVRVLTRADMPLFGRLPPFRAGALSPPMQGDEIRYEGEPVAIVLATTLEAAEEARALVKVHYAPQPPVLPGAGARESVVEALAQEEEFSFWPYGRPYRRGDADAVLASAHVRIAATYVQPTRHHNPMETSGTLVRWDGNRLTVWDSVQGSVVLPPVYAAAFGIDPEDVHIIAPHTGGGFGCKGWVWPHQLLAVAAARIVGRPVKLHLSRTDQYTATGYQPLVTQRVELGANREGRLTALRHRASSITGLVETYVEAPTQVRDLYACPVIDVDQDVERVSFGVPTPMRTTNSGPGLWALESALNELAHEMQIDPLELRLRNYAETDPISGRPWSSKRLRDAYEQGAELFGWRERHRGGWRDGHWRIGSGMATAAHSTMRQPGRARVRLQRDGSVRIESDAQDVGTGLQTLLTQIAADELNLPVEDVTIAWGDSALPATGPVWGSSTIHTGGAVALACREVRRKLAEVSDSATVTGAIRDANVDEIVAEATSGLPGGVPADYGGGASGYAMGVWGAVFVEVAVDPELGLVRLRRMVGSYSAGRIMNSRTARSQMIGGLAFSWSKATMERSEIDPVAGRWLSKNLSGVHVPTNADIPGDITIHFVDEVDTHASAIGGKGIGELAATGIDAAVADAVFDAVGIRVRELPITPKRLLPSADTIRTGPS
jgi:xanthine dehydrogenase YagR molybdenum-binding subunit